MTPTNLEELKRAAEAFYANRSNWQAWDAFTNAATCDTILSLIAELEAERERNEWRPIETAPRDGTDVFLWRAYSPPVVAGWFSSEGHSGDWYTFDAPHSAVSGLVTHWRPLPEPLARAHFQSQEASDG